MEGKKTPRRAVVKKRTGPLFSEEILNEISSKPPVATPQPSSSHTSRRNPSVKEKKEKKRERWLLTRKTWKYMADAGRKLIPEGVQNRPEDIQRCEKHFNAICANESKFILWRRKASYPGAMGGTRNSKRRLKLLLSHTHKAVDEETEESRNADQVIDLLQNILKLDESRKTTTLLGSKTVRPDQTSSPSAQRPGGSKLSSQSMAMSSRGPVFLPPLAQPSQGINALSEIDQLLERLRTLSRSASCRNVIPLDRITPKILEDKQLLKQIYNELKKQQLHRILGKHSTTHSGPRATLPHASSLSSLLHFRRDGSIKGNGSFFSGRSQKPPTTSSSETPDRILGKRAPPSSLDLPNPLSSSLQLQSTQIPMISIKKPSAEVNYATCGTQTDFIELNEIERLAKDYKEMKREELAAMSGQSGGQPTDDESDKGATASNSHRRKSSIDNEDVSQSVSDTIKRYLRMARKKSVHDDNASRFKRVNYDRNLRNIRAGSEINPPGMDEGNNKATQTLDAWSLICLNFIRGNENTTVLEEAHLDWKNNLDQRIKRKQEYEEKVAKQQQQQRATVTKATHSSSSSSAPPSPTNQLQPQGHGNVSTASGILHSSTQFLSNLWHGYHQHGGQDGYHPLPSSKTNSTNSIVSAGTTTSGLNYSSKDDNIVMQKSKSSSNVGQFVSKKIWKTRSKSQTRTSSPTKAEWTPRGNNTWTSNTGRQVTLTDVHLQTLSEIEAKILQRVAIEKINQLNIGVSVAAPPDDDAAGKCQKRRPLAKKKAMTTSFFDIGKKDDKGSQMGVFGNSLENCVAYDQKRRTNLTSSSDRGSRNSITSLFRGSSNSKVRSCESLPSGSFTLPHSDSNSMASSGMDMVRGSGNGNLAKSAAMQMSRSQSDVRRSSQDYDDLQLNSSMLVPPPMIDANDATTRQVPTFVQECIKHLEKYGLHMVGIFRVSTSKKRVRQMREEFDRSTNTAIDPETCPHDVATLLKEFLRDLPEPLLCRNLYKAFIKTQKIRNRRLQLEALSHLVQLLPTAHRDTLYVLLKFLAKVASCCDDITGQDGSVQVSGNKMDTTNLATVFAPNILRSSLPSEENNEHETVGDVINVIRTMIDHYEELFRVPAELIDEVYTNMIDTFPEQLNYLCERRNISENDESESGSLSTPLSSPPPVPIAKVGSDSVFRPPPLIKKSNEPPPGKSSPVPMPRRIYTRESVMHSNSASKGHPSDDTSLSGSRRRSSKLKHSENDTATHHHNQQQQMQQQQQSRLFGSSGGSNRPKTDNNSDNLNAPPKVQSTTIEFHSMHQHQQQQQQQQQQHQHQTIAGTITTRRLSSPYVFDRTGVVTASLKIPVQVQTTGGSNTNTIDDEAFRSETGQFDLSNIPYIEDSSYGNELGSCNEGFPITGSLSFGGAGSSGSGQGATNVRKVLASHKTTGNARTGPMVYQIPINYEGQQLPSDILGTGGSGDDGKINDRGGTVHSNSTSKLASFPSSGNTTTTTTQQSSSIGLTFRSVEKPIRAKNLFVQQQQKQTPDNQVEPKLPTSISNIGGAILRSKTADFERMSNASSSSASASLPLLSASTPSNTGSSLRGTLYKRQELISSAKRTSK